MRTKRKPQSVYQYEPLVTPSNWNGEERQFVIRLTQLFDQLFAKKSGVGGSSSGTPGEPGEDGKDGKDGVGIASVVQTTTSTADNGENIITVTLTDGSANRFSVRNGSKGNTGDKGEKGDQGPQGIQGETGPQGEQGLQGPKGDTGPAGPKGDTGAVGPQGPAGASGKDGSPGKDGVDGKDGRDGYTPVRGVDYWTAEDKEEIINEVSGSAGGGGSANEIVTLTAEEYEALTTEEKAALYAQGVRVLAVESAFDADSLTDMQKFAAFAHPVGEIVELTIATNPAALWGFGTWESYMPGRVLVGAGTADSGTVYEAGQTGGEETHALTVSEMPAHNHGEYGDFGSSAELPLVSDAAAGPLVNGAYFSRSSAGSISHSSKHVLTTTEGGSQPHNIMQPYGVVYRWLRTA